MNTNLTEKNKEDILPEVSEKSRFFEKLKPLNHFVSSEILLPQENEQIDIVLDLTAKIIMVLTHKNDVITVYDTHQIEYSLLNITELGKLIGYYLTLSYALCPVNNFYITPLVKKHPNPQVKPTRQKIMRLERGFFQSILYSQKANHKIKWKFLNIAEDKNMFFVINNFISTNNQHNLPKLKISKHARTASSSDSIEEPSFRNLLFYYIFDYCLHKENYINSFITDNITEEEIVLTKEESDEMIKDTDANLLARNIDKP